MSDIRNTRGIVIFKGEEGETLKNTLSRAIKEGANLRRASLQGANLRGANLQEANLQGANLQEANLQGANLQEADLQWANLRGANLQEANLRRASLQWANLRGANLRGANLRGASLQGAGLRGASLRGADLPPFQIPQEGELIVYKKTTCGVVKLRIPPDARRTASLIGRKCRAEFAGVLEAPPGARSLHNSSLRYETGKIVHPDHYSDDIRVECAPGIHFFLTREEAEAY